MSSLVVCARRSFATSEALTSSSHTSRPLTTFRYSLSYSTHTSVLFAIIFVFVYTVYATSDKIGSFSAMHELLTKASEAAPVDGNAHGSYLTMRSKNGLIFGIINVIGNFATVFQDQAVSTRLPVWSSSSLMNGRSTGNERLQVALRRA